MYVKILLLLVDLITRLVPSLGLKCQIGTRF